MLFPPVFGGKAYIALSIPALSGRPLPPRNDTSGGRTATICGACISVRLRTGSGWTRPCRSGPDVPLRRAAGHRPWNSPVMAMHDGAHHPAGSAREPGVTHAAEDRFRAAGSKGVISQVPGLRRRRPPRRAAAWQSGHYICFEFPKSRLLPASASMFTQAKATAGLRGDRRRAPGGLASTTSWPTRPDAAFARRTVSDRPRELLRAGGGRSLPKGRRYDARAGGTGIGLPRSGCCDPARTTVWSIPHGGPPRPCRRRGRRTSCAAQLAPHPAREEAP